MTDRRADRARRLCQGWQEAAAELTTNVWFGDAVRVDRDARDAFTRTIAGPASGGLDAAPGRVAALHRAWSDPLVRHDLLHDTAAAHDLDALPSSFTGNGEQFARLLAEGELAGARLALDQLVDRTCAGGSASEHFDRVFAERVLRDMSDGPVAAVTPTEDVRDRLVTVAARMATAAPELFASAWSFVGDVVVIGEAPGRPPRESMPDSFSQPGLSGVVFFSPAVLALPWHAEVTLLHEAVHQKLYTLLLTRPLYEREGVDDETAVPIPWRATTWTPRRTISALHAYVHMSVALAALIEAAVDQGRPLDPPDGSEEDPLVLLRVHQDRMAYLADRSRGLGRAHLAEAGLDLVRWLGLVADDITRGPGRTEESATDSPLFGAPAPAPVDAGQASPNPSVATTPTTTWEWVLLSAGIEQCLFDVTFLGSRWACLWSRGRCPGLREKGQPEHDNGCCQMGAVVDQAEVAKLKRSVAQLSEADWDPELSQHQVNAGLTPTRPGVWQTQKRHGACIFHNRDGRGCAFHQLAERTGQSVLDLKPDVCWQVPLYYRPGRPPVLGGRQDRDWTEDGSDPGWAWWCATAHDPNAYEPDNPPVWQSMRAEITRMVGEALYAELAAYFTTRAGSWMSVPPAQAVALTRKRGSARTT